MRQPQPHWQLHGLHPVLIARPHLSWIPHSLSTLFSIRGLDVPNALQRPPRWRPRVQCSGHLGVIHSFPSQIDCSLLVPYMYRLLACCSVFPTNGTTSKIGPRLWNFPSRSIYSLRILASRFPVRPTCIPEHAIGILRPLPQRFLGGDPQ